MSRRQRTTLTLSVRIPVLAGRTQTQVLENVKEALRTGLGPGFAELIVKIEQRETTYL